MAATPCPTCHAPVDDTQPANHRPFCSPRCRLLDLGRWLNGDYRVPVLDDDEDAVALTTAGERVH
jgi:endogenous inhibitor of DNA gyrase (YacG/DUF329 family)